MSTKLINKKLKLIIACPKCFSNLVIDDKLYCVACDQEFPIINGLPAPIIDSSIIKILTKEVYSILLNFYNKMILIMSIVM